ncbi:3'-5' exonuclease [Candidatus Palauibacter soopunensis]|uniref:3'-5' exonuclease n=1 Tax=Candidatus Palauibacter soopunensis TaxID=3056739 RepID=UPI002392FA31|nr:3'-5' exonuclease [Candidatus Palauibacter soopunensis]MDE2879825.1 3'-5' exonuclease [Candidatus Palauibacter soopunensis]
MTGLHFAPNGVLVRKALRRLEGGPRSSVDLAADVLGMHGCPPAMAGRLVAQLLEGIPEVARDGEGGDAWRLAGEGRRNPKPAAKGLHDLRYAVVDVETNGGFAEGNGRVVEIAIVDVDRGAIGGCYSTLVDAGVTIPPWITRLTGIRTEMTHGAPSFSQICDRVREHLRGRVFVAHNAAYDWGFLRAEMRRAGAGLPRGPRLCTVHLARRLIPGLERRGLDSVADYYGIEIRERHRARGDAVATARILVRMLEDAERRGWTTWPALRKALGPVPRRERGKRRDRRTERQEPRERRHE